MISEISKCQAIQICYPDEPEWEEVEDHVLVELVENFSWEQSCATSAILELGYRQHLRAKELAHWLLAQAEADQWLKAAAQDSLGYFGD